MATEYEAVQGPPAPVPAAAPPLLSGAQISQGSYIEKEYMDQKNWQVLIKSGVDLYVWKQELELDKLKFTWQNDERAKGEKARKQKRNTDYILSLVATGSLDPSELPGLMGQYDDPDAVWDSIPDLIRRIPDEPDVIPYDPGEQAVGRMLGGEFGDLPRGAFEFERSGTPEEQEESEKRRMEREAARLKKEGWDPHRVATPAAPSP